MMRKERKKTAQKMSTVLVAISAGAFLVSCATTEVTALWRDETYREQPQKVLVQAVLKNPTNRRIVESEFARQFRSRGVEAVPAYTIFSGDDLATKEELEKQLSAGKFDTLLLMRLVGTKTETQVVPGTVTHQPSYPASAYPSPRHGAWPGYYGSGYTTVYSPSYTVEDRYAVAETGLYDAATQRLIWTATSETAVSESDQKLIKTYVKVMMDSLRKSRLVP